MVKFNVDLIEIFFRDGVPLNEHFLALKTKYTTEKEQFEKAINELKLEIMNIDHENKKFEEEITLTNKNYFDYSDKWNKNSNYYKEKIYE